MLIGMQNFGRRPSAAERDFAMAKLETLAVMIANLKGTEAAFWRQMLKSMKAYTEYRYHMDLENAGPADIARRDAAMGDNLIWLAREAFAGRKIIVWAATYHNIRNLHLAGNSDPYTQVKTMGHFVWDVLGDATYNVAFLGYEGLTGWADGGMPETNSSGRRSTAWRICGAPRRRTTPSSTCVAWPPADIGCRSDWPHDPSGTTRSRPR